MTENALRRRPKALMMTPEERDAFLLTQRTCRVATSGADGPHLSPLWFVWDGTALWLYSLVDSRRWRHLLADPRVSVLVDDGEEFGELRGVEFGGVVERVGEIPRVGGDVPELIEPERLFGVKYTPEGSLTHDARHGWLRLVPGREASWDFRRMRHGRSE